MIELTIDKKRILIEKIKEFFLNERNEELGELASELILDFFIQELGKEIYNKGIEDAYTLIQDRTEDVLSLQKM